MSLTRSEWLDLWACAHRIQLNVRTIRMFVANRKEIQADLWRIKELVESVIGQVS